MKSVFTLLLTATLFAVGCANGTDATTGSEATTGEEGGSQTGNDSSGELGE